MDRQAVILESRTMRDSLTSRTEALDRAKALRLLPDDLHLTTRLVAEYFEVGEEAVKSLVKRHREELLRSGYRLLQGDELRKHLGSTLDPRSVPGRGLALFTRRAVLNVAMLLRDSEVARQVRVQLLDLADAARPSAGLDALVEEIVARATPRLLAVARQAARQAAQEAARQVAEEVVAGRLESHARVVGAMSCRLADLDSALREVRSRMDSLCTQWSQRSEWDRRRKRRCRCR
ncbi:hypothetical protein ACIQGZ_01365 [Streptomyces sp. NPDC092296]|uniref:hypothetical protein n=1 Tax=Streptomyces sp. NPDC092296 TaxID=3366012 RepID=UPI003827CEAA